MVTWKRDCLSLNLVLLLYQKLTGLMYVPHLGLINDFIIDLSLQVLKLNETTLQNFVVTFLISGVTIETSLELVAHKEASVARLTSSKTHAMNLPLFRVQVIITNILSYLGINNNYLGTRCVGSKEIH